MSDLPRSAPSAQGVDAAGVLAVVDAVEAAGLELHSLMVLRHGHVVAEGWWAPYSPDRVHLLYSLSKSFASAATGFAVAEGLVDWDATVLSYFPELDAEITDPRSRAIRVRDVAAMASGHEAETIERAWATDPTDLVRAFLLLPPERDPGTLFTYNQPCTHALSAIVQRVSGQRLTEYLGPRLFAPLGITTGGWHRAPSGVDLGFTGLHLTTDSVARFGQCLLDGGRYAGQQVLPAGWVDLASAVHVPTADSAGESAADASGGDWAQGYGFQFWRSRHGFRGDGAYGQFCLVLPEHDAVVVTTAGTEDMQAVLDVVWAHLLPAFRDDAPADSEAALAQRLAGLRLPVPAPGGDLPAGTWTTTGAGPGLPDAVTVRPDGDVLTVELDLAGEHLSLCAGHGRWLTNEPGEGLAAVAAAVGTGPDGVAVVELAPLELPHRLRLVLREDGTLLPSWHTRPLGTPRLRSMARPLPTSPRGA